MSKIIAVSMSKGGVGKSVTSVNLSAALSMCGKKVLIVDIDPQQGNATLSLGQTPSKLKFTIANVISLFLDLGQVTGLEQAIISLSDTLDLLPANPKLEAIQNRLIAERLNAGIFEDEESVPSQSILKHLLATIQDQYDFIIIDCPPSVSMLTINALVASNSVILPMEAHYESYEALSHIWDVIARIKANYNPDLAVEGILVTKYQNRTRLCREVSKFTEQNFGDKIHIFPETIPLSIAAAELSSLGESIFEHAPQSEVAAAYKNLAEEVMSNA
jgi:chromosome partitioning protein